MWQSLVKTLSEFLDQWSKFSNGKKVGFFLVLTILVGCLIALGAWIGKKSYAPLYTSLQPEESIALVKVLQADNIPYSVSENGATISIPPELVQQTLMRLAVKGTPGGQRPGMELFDKESFGTSSYVQRINYVRALQGELSRTIETIKAVKKSTVHISLPPKSGVFEKSEDPKASVVVELQPGRDLVKDEVRGIQQLVAASVEGLRPERVTVVNSSGMPLSTTGDGVTALSQTMLEHQKKIEESLESRVEDIVSRIVGHGNVVARVNADLDFDPLSEKEVLYDPEQSAVKSETKREDNMEGSRPTVGGVAGAQGALPGPASAPPEAKQNVAKSDQRTNYEISTKTRSREKAPGAVKRISVAVLVNTAQGVDKDGKATVTPLSPELKSSIEKLVKDAVGFAPTRGDAVTIENATFAKENLDNADDFLSRQERRQLIYQLVSYGTVALVVLLFFMMVVRPFVRWITGVTTTKVETVLPKTVEELESMHVPQTNALPGLANLPMLEETFDLEKAEGELLKEKVISLVNMAPSKAAQIISDWLEEADSLAGGKGKRK